MTVSTMVAAAVQERWDEYVRSHLAGKPAPAAELADFFAVHGLDPRAFDLEMELLRQRPALEARIADRGRVEAEVTKARNALAAARAEIEATHAQRLREVPEGTHRGRQLASLKEHLRGELELALAEPRRALARAEAGRHDATHAAARLAQIDRAVKNLRTRLFGRSR